MEGLSSPRLSGGSPALKSCSSSPAWWPGASALRAVVALLTWAALRGEPLSFRADQWEVRPTYLSAEFGPGSSLRLQPKRGSASEAIYLQGFDLSDAQLH